MKQTRKLYETRAQDLRNLKHQERKLYTAETIRELYKAGNTAFKKLN